MVDSIVRFRRAKSEDQIKEAGGYVKVVTYMGDDGSLAFAPMGQKEQTTRWGRKVVEVYEPLEIVEGEIVGIIRGI